jgi:hypothetical protein
VACLLAASYDQVFRTGEQVTSGLIGAERDQVYRLEKS